MAITTYAVPLLNVELGVSFFLLLKKNHCFCASLIHLHNQNQTEHDFHCDPTSLSMQANEKCEEEESATYTVF